MALFNGRASKLEAENRALISAARDRAERIDELERELQAARQRTERIDTLERELQGARQMAARVPKLERELRASRAKEQTGKLERELQQARHELERLTLERDFFSQRMLELEEHNRQLTEAATKYSLWGQKLERELAKIDPDGAAQRQFGACVL
jgi:chromosome segregation ATPase